MSSGFGTNDKKDIDELVKKIELKIKDLRSDFTKDVTVLKNQLTVCATELDRLKELLESVSDYSHSEYEKLERKSQEFEEAIADIRTKLNTIQYNEVLEGKCASGINEYPIYARYAEKDISGNSIPSYYATKSEVSGVSATLSGDYTQKIADSSSAGASALSSVSSQLTNAIEEERQRATSADQELSGTISSVSSTLSTNLENTSSTLQQRIDNEISRATDKESELETAIDNEQTRATNVEEELNTNIDTLGTYVDTQVGLLENSIEDVSTTLTTDLNNEIERATTEESRIASLLDGEITDRTNADTALGERITSEETARTNADSALQTRIESEEQTRQTNVETLQTNIDNEAQTRETNDSALQDSINAEETARIAAITAEQQARTTTINSLSSEIDENYYTKDEVDEAIANFGGFEVHSTTADITIPKSNIIYLIGPDTSVTGNDKYVEYIYDNGFILIGETTVDLANYYNKYEINTFTSNLNDSIAAETTRATGAENTISQNIVTSTTNLENKITNLSGTVNETIESLSGEIDTQFTEVNNSITDLDSRKQNVLSAGDGIDITNDVVSHSIKVIENNDQEDTVEDTIMTVYLKNNHYKVITLDPTVTEIHFLITETDSNVLQETGFEFQVPTNSVLTDLEFRVIDNENIKIYTIIPKTYKAPNIYQGTIVNYRCTIGEYKVE